MKILIFGLLVVVRLHWLNRLQNYLEVSAFNADEVRKKYEGHDMSKWDFTEQGRLTQAQRIRHIADGVVEPGRVAVADFVCPYS